MFIVLLKFSSNKANAAQWMEGHKAWLQRGFDDGVFMLAGSLKPNRGGAVLAHRTTMDELQARVDADPFVAENVVSAQIMEIAPARADERLGFLLG
ncbi:YciI family protein [Variovorax paradoxus]|uniref:YciI family protein n=1 Tax=Variovorax paradoxus TaxID=34073 RepID=UPI002480AAF4|nr:YciI family protein [Variovorax paradoxus]WGT65880.1 YciI family protein [Variovorax paradoxus]